MAAETQHPYQRNNYQGTELIQQHLDSLYTSKKGYPLMNDEDFKFFCMLRQRCFAHFTRSKADQILKDTMDNFRKTGELLFILQAPD